MGLTDVAEVKYRDFFLAEPKLARPSHLSCAAQAECWCAPVFSWPREK